MADPIQKPDRSPRVPEPYGTVCPWVITRDTGAFIDFATAAFGAKEIATEAPSSCSVPGPGLEIVR